MKKKLYKYGLLYIGVALAACADNADLNEPAGSTTPPAQVLNATVKNLLVRQLSIMTYRMIRI